MLYSWFNWTFEVVYFVNLPVLAFIENLNSNTLGFYFASSLPMLFFLRRTRNLNLITFLALLAVILFSTLSTISKGAIITATLVIIFYSIKTFSSMFFLGITGSLIIYGFWDIAVKRWTSSQTSNQARVDLITSAYEMFSTSPIVGVGPKGYSTTGLTEVTDAHNALFNILAEYGLLGFAAYIIFLLYIFMFYVPKVMKFSKDTGYFLLVYFGSIQTCGMTTGLTYSDKISWIVLGCIAGV